MYNKNLTLIFNTNYQQKHMSYKKAKTLKKQIKCVSKYKKKIFENFATRFLKGNCSAFTFYC